MKVLTLLLIGTLYLGCSEKKNDNGGIELIAEPKQQDSLFRSLISLIRDSALQSRQLDSMAFLVLPVEASCPSCRKKTIDSLMKHKGRILPNHFIIITAPTGIKRINAHFMEQKYQIPTIEHALFIDSNYMAYKLNLFDANPAIYYAHNAKVYMKVVTAPRTIREDLREFFSGNRIEQSKL